MQNNIDIKAVFFDLDGTLLSFKTHEIPVSAQEALHKLKQKGIKRILATGRAEKSVEFVKHHFDGIVALNGQYCICDNKLIYYKAINPEDVSALTEQAKGQSYAYCFVEAKDSYADKITKELIDVYNSINQELPRVGMPKADSVIYQMLVALPEGKEQMIYDATNDIEITRWHPQFIDIIPKQGGKDFGVRAMLEYFGINKENIMAIGDGENDISMINFAKIGVAMGNASDLVKQNADYITTDVDKDGIHKALKHYNVI